MKSQTAKLSITIIITLLIIIAMVAFGVLPYFDKLISNRTQLINLKQKLFQAKDKLGSLTQLQKDQLLISDTKKVVDGYLPDGTDSSSFVIQLESLSSDLLIPENITTLSTVDPNDKKNASSTSQVGDQQTQTNNNASVSQNSSNQPKDVIEFSLKFKSNYSTIIEFINRMYTFPRFNTFSILEISGYDPETDLLNLSINGEIYYGE